MSRIYKGWIHAEALSMSGLFLAVLMGIVFCIQYGGGSLENFRETGPFEEMKSAEELERTQIFLNRDRIFVSGPGAAVFGTTVVIVQGGIYSVSGSLSNGQIYVEAQDRGTVILELNGAEISNDSAPAIYVEQAELTQIFLGEHTRNRICSGTLTGEGEESGETVSQEEAAEEDVSGGAIYARDDLSVSGTGSLEVQGLLNNGIQTSNKLVIDSGSLSVTAKNNGLKGKDSVTIHGGSFHIDAEKDGIKSSSTEGEGFGVVSVFGGEFIIQAGDDGIHAETALEISGGTIEIPDCYEGLEANRILISGGDLSITASDDGINANGGPDHQGMGAPGDQEMPGKPPFDDGREEPPFDDGREKPPGNKMGEPPAGQAQSSGTEEELPLLRITGGTIRIHTEGDGLDSNGDLQVEGGLVLVDGPSRGGNGAIDFGSENGGVCTIADGTVLVAGDETAEIEQDSVSAGPGEYARRSGISFLKPSHK